MDSSASRTHFIPRCGPPSAARTVLAKHLSSYSARVADRVVHACAWTDGAVDVVFGDGTVLAFADHMNTFVAFAPPGAQTGGCPEESVGRDMQYTRWALSKYRRKVAAALACFNYYSPEPRLFAEFVAPSHVQVWQHVGPVDTLVLSRDAALLERRRVVRPVIVSSEDACAYRAKAMAQDASSPLLVPPHFPLSELEVLAASTDPMRAVAHVCVGVEVTLWCALRRVSLTIHPRGRTFTVRWPAPLDVPPPQSSHAAAGGWLSAEAVVRDARARSAGQTHVVWVEQCFPVCAPPRAWAAMLQLALELHESTPLPEWEAIMSVTAAPPVAQTSMDGALRDSPLYYGQLPTPRGSQAGTLARGTLFSTMQPQHAQLLRAAGVHQRGDWHWQREVHGTSGSIEWRLDMDPSADTPPAVYWGIAPSVDAEGGDCSACLPSDVTTAVCAVVREDESTVWVQPHGSGYGVEHTTADGQRHTYHMSANGSTGVPPVAGTLAFADYVFHVSQHWGPHPDHNRVTHYGEWSLEEPSGVLARSHMGSRKGHRARVFPPPPPAHPRALDDRRRGTVLYPVGDEAAQLREYPILAEGDAQDEGEADEEEELALFWGQCASGGAGHYLKAVARVCTELLQWSLTAQRAVKSQNVPSSPRHGLLLSRRTPSTVAAEDTNGSLFQHFIQGGGTQPVRAVGDSALFLTTRLDGIGNFTALTNGVVRCHFDDRTLLTLTPGLNEFDESGLAASCLFRDATRCVMRVSQCRDPSHPLYRYLAYALPFRRYVMMEAAARRHGDGAIASLPDLDITAATTWSDAESTGAALGERMPRTPARRGALSFQAVNSGRPAQCPRPASAQQSDLSPYCASEQATEVRGDTSQGHAAPPLSLYLTTLDETLMQQRRSDTSALQASDARIESLLAENARLRKINESLLLDA